MPEKKSFFDSVNDFTMKIAEPMFKFASIPWVSALQEGMVGFMSPVIIGSVFLVLSVLALPWIATGTGDPKPLLPFLTPYAGNFLVLFSLTMGLMALLASITIAMAYARKLNVNQTSAAVLSLTTFILFTTNSTTLSGTVNDAAGNAISFSIGGISIGNFGAQGLFVAILIGLLSVKIYKLVVDSGVVIKMPEGVPPMIAASFTSLIPYTVVFVLAWLIRTVLGFDFTGWLLGLLGPVFQAADNIFMYTFTTFLGNLLWSAGIHGDGMLGAITGPFTAMTVAANAEAMAAGQAMPYIWTPQLQRMNVWTSTVWPLFIFLWFSKVPGHKTLFWTALPAGIFTIIEPIMFGLPLALNPILFIPFMVSTILGSIVSYLAVMIGFVGRFFANLPWATPPFLLGPLASGDWKWVIIIALNVVIGYFVYLPFWRVYEKRELARIAAEKE